MKLFTSSVLASLLLLIGVPVSANPDMQAIQIFDCEFNGEASSDEMFAVASDWLAAARKTKGGENLQLAIRFPIAEGAAGDGDFRFVIVLPSFTEWGEFTDAYEGSAVAKVDDKLHEIADCAYSTMWEGIRIK